MSFILILFAPEKRKGVVALFGVIINAVLSSVPAINGLFYETVSYSFYGGSVFGEIALRIDPLCAWFLLIMNFTSVTAILYGTQYLKAYNADPSRLSVHFASYLLNHFAMIFIYIVQNTLAFLCFWEIMAVTAFMMVIFDHHKMETLKAGINYLIQSHISILFLMLGFIWVNFKTGSFDFLAIAQFSSLVQPALAFVLFFLFFFGFAIKAGFIPFHTWLPYAHPAAPSHVSGLMSGVIIKLGIYGIARMILLIEMNYTLVGVVILVISLLSGIYGVMLAITQHNLKRLLAYHSIENIGIIGVGIGLGTIGKGLGNEYLEFAGFGGAFLHTLNHSLFKSLLFYMAGAVYQVTHQLNIEKLGGIIKKMPQTSLLFLAASVAICGLPPFNGFISEFLIFTGLFSAIHLNSHLSFTVLIILSVFGLVIIGGLALFCFTKAFSVVFLGSARSVYPEEIKERNFKTLLPGYLVLFLIFTIGLFPHFFIYGVSKVIGLFSGNLSHMHPVPYFVTLMQKVGFTSWGIIILAFLVYRVKKFITSKSVSTVRPTWGCGYETASSKLQYTSTSFSRSFRELVNPLLKVHRYEDKIKTIVPGKVRVEMHIIDKLEFYFIDEPVKHLRSFIGRFKFLQNGSVQFYILYGVVFILIGITIPILIRATYQLFALFKQL
jgi:formate hydrogenlyase subunit 3/multisubunit Na+/H+ antiporter MnhD subunit